MEEEDEADSAWSRFAALVRREMHASNVRVLPPGTQPSTAKNVLAATLDDGRQVVVVFEDAPPDKGALARRLEMLVRTFAQSLDTSRERQSVRPSLARSLVDELVALALRARAVDALVIDANSPVVWGSAQQKASSEPAPEPAVEGVRLVQISDGGDRGAPNANDSVGSPRAVPRLLGDTPKPPGLLGDTPKPPGLLGDTPKPPEPAASEEVLSEGGEALEDLSAEAARLVRAHPSIPSLHKGGRLHAVVRDGGADVREGSGPSTARPSYVAHSFASIYVLVLVYAEPFDELRAERAIAEALPRIERLVLALPSRDPPPAPIAGVVAFGRRRRR